MLNDEDVSPNLQISVSVTLHIFASWSSTCTVTPMFVVTWDCGIVGLWDLTSHLRASN